MSRFTANLPQLDRGEFCGCCFNDLVFMLSPQECESTEHADVDLGRRFAHWRRARGWRQMDAACQMANASVHIVGAIEQKKHYVHLT
jgi:hypothetical protein